MLVVQVHTLVIDTMLLADWKKDLGNSLKLCKITI